RRNRLEIYVGAGERKRSRGLAAERRQRMTDPGTFPFERWQLGFRTTELGFGLGDVEVAGNSTGAAIAREFERTLVRLDALRDDRMLSLQQAKREIID